MHEIRVVTVWMTKGLSHAHGYIFLLLANLKKKSFETTTHEKSNMRHQQFGMPHQQQFLHVHLFNSFNFSKY